jgi:hypothetical protein
MNPYAIRELMSKLESAGFLYGPYKDSKLNTKHTLLGMPLQVARETLVENIFTKGYEPGTFTIGERKAKPEYISIDDPSSFEDWVIEEAHSDLDRLIPIVENHCPWILPSKSDINSIPREVLECFDYMFDEKTILADEIYQQEYTDVIRRLNCIYLTGWPRLPFNEYDEVNTKLLPVGLRIAAKCENVDLPTLLRISTASGLIGINFKRNASATSVLYTNNIIPVTFERSMSKLADQVFGALLDKSNNGWGINCENEFIYQVLNSRKQLSLIFFTDDFLESIIDLKLIEHILRQNLNLRVTIVPRASRFGNDASYQDIYYFIQQNTFKYLLECVAKKRLFIEPGGPLSGNVNGLRLSKNVLGQIMASDIVFAKGARSFECLQGLKKPAFFAFAVCRSISEAVTGIDAETGKLVLIYQEQGRHSFIGYRKRHLRPKISSSGRMYWLAERTTMEILNERRQ